LRVDLKAEARKLELEMVGGEETEAPSPSRQWDQRAYRLSGAWDGKSVAALERTFAPERVFVDRIRRGTEISDATPESGLRDGDVISVTGWRTALAGEASLGVETYDRELLSLPIVALDAVVTRKELDNRTIRSLAEKHGRGVGLLQLIRGGEEIPFAAATRVNRGDLLRLVGTKRDVERVGASLGYIERTTSATDVVFLGAGIFIGGLLGMLSVGAGDVRLSLTASGGALVMGLVFGWLRSLRPTYGRIPEPALWVFDTVGLAVFIGCVGLTAGPGFVEGLKTTGPSLIFVGIGVAATPHLIALLFGRHVLKMNPVILLGACAGAGTMTAGLRAIQDEAQSKLPVLGYTVPYAIGNILLTAWGPVIVLLMR
jgi:putative transport protein